MRKFVLSDKCEVTFSRVSDDTPVIIFEDLLLNQVAIDKQGIHININLDVDKDAMEEIIDALSNK